ncbi:response regulator transcription factor [Persicimonas caeni]|uniref:Response regulator transcription factor n=1 Tax=Persicimonas caeni TaxID=2292766 RepID=A0A4Y6PTM6_PERCE|nr:LytTR family DNA-binding domain-containing protein [Persicimonas caeni]QDG51479.1 response regulator transcription factor [Persicimonas caeni]QED32700.1 response regulator transcription factor [Persicimonas caeni]
MKALIVDDEKPAREELQWLLEQCEDVEVAGQAASAEGARDFLEGGDAGEVDLVFLDINMPGVDGMRLAELLHEKPVDERPMVIFVTAYDDHAVDAFEVDAVDYLLKPVRLERLQKALERARGRLNDPPESAGAAPAAQNRPLERISVEDRGVYRVVPIDDILFFEAEDGIVVAATREDRFITDFSLKFLEDNLSADKFFRCHRSYIVRLDAIESIAPWGAGTYRLVLSRDEDLGVPLSRSRASELKSLIPWSARVVDG